MHHHALAWQLLTAEDSHAGDLHMSQIDRHRAWCDEACRGMCGSIYSEGARCGASGQGVTTTDFVASAPYVFLATVPVELPSVGAVQALSLFVAGADPQDGPGEPSMPLMAAG